MLEIPVQYYKGRSFPKEWNWPCWTGKHSLRYRGWYWSLNETRNKENWEDQEEETQMGSAERVVYLWKNGFQVCLTSR